MSEESRLSPPGDRGTRDQLPLEPVVPFLDRRDRKTFSRDDAPVGHRAGDEPGGRAGFAAAGAHTEMLGAPLRVALDELSAEATGGGFAPVLYKAIFAGWLVALMSWLIGSTRSAGAQIVLVLLTTAPISAFGFRHSVAGSTEAFYRAFRGTAGWGEMSLEFIIRATIGNAIGGVVLAALLNHGKAGK